MNSNSNQLTIPLKNNNPKGFDTISMLLLALSYLSFLYKAFALYSIVGIIAYALIGVVSIIVYINITSKKWPLKYIHIVFIVAGCAWFYQMGTGLIIGLLVILAGAVRVKVSETPKVTADDKGIAVKNVLAKRYPWADLNNAVIKDGLLTIDCKNNRLLQKETSDEIAEKKEVEFNGFCRVKLQFNQDSAQGKA